MPLAFSTPEDTFAFTMTALLRLAAPPVPQAVYRFAWCMPAVPASFQQRHPGIEVVALEGTDEEVEDWLARDSIDLAVVLNPASERNDLVLGRDAWMGLMSSAHPLGRRATAQGIELSELAKQPFILATGGCAVNG